MSFPTESVSDSIVASRRHGSEVAHEEFSTSETRFFSFGFGTGGEEGGEVLFVDFLSGEFSTGDFGSRGSVGVPGELDGGVSESLRRVGEEAKKGERVGNQLEEDATRGEGKGERLTSVTKSRPL